MSDTITQGSPSQAAAAAGDPPLPQHELNEHGGHDHISKSAQQPQAETQVHNGTSDGDDQDDVGISDEDISQLGFETRKGLSVSMMTAALKLIKLDSSAVQEFVARYRPLWDPATRSIEDYLVTPLHVLARDPQGPSKIALLSLFIKEAQDLMIATNSVGKTAMHVAIENRNYDILNAMCRNLTDSDLDKVLAIQDELNRENCLHLAILTIPKGLKRQTVLGLIKKASEPTLCGQDKRRRTPLHLAVDYMLCSESQLGIVKELLLQGEKALELDTEDHLSVYQYHLWTRDKNNLDKIADGNKPSRESIALSDNGDQTRPEGHRIVTSLKPVHPTQQNANVTDIQSKSNMNLVTADSAKKIEDEVKVHYIRTTVRGPRKQRDAERFLFGGRKDLSLSLELPPTVPMDIAELSEALRCFRFCDVLRVVSAPFKFEGAPEDKHDFPVVFEWLLKRAGVKHIVRVVADDIENPPCDDERIEGALANLVVEELDWRKNDLCPRTIQKVGNDLRVLWLYWAGNNAILRAWSEPEGLAKLPNLEEIYLNVTKNTERYDRMRLNIREFEGRLHALQPALKVFPTFTETRKGPPIAQGQSEPLLDDQIRRWFDTIYPFNKLLLHNLIDSQERPGKTPEIALIDSAVDIFDPGIRGKVASLTNINNQEERESASGGDTRRGTLIAKTISRTAWAVARTMRLHAINIKELLLWRATEAVKEAIARKVDIICMAWLARGTDDEAKSFSDALKEASELGIVMFCLAWDGDATRSGQFIYPAEFKIPHLYRVGAVFGDEWPSAEVRLRRNIDIILPGQSHERSETTNIKVPGIAPAIAAGLAGLIVYCASIVGPLSYKSSVVEKHVIISGFISYVKRRQDVEQNLSTSAGWDGFENFVRGSHDDYNRQAQLDLVRKMLNQFLSAAERTAD